MYINWYPLIQFVESTKQGVSFNGVNQAEKEIIFFSSSISQIALFWSKIAKLTVKTQFLLKKCNDKLSQGKINRVHEES